MEGSSCSTRASRDGQHLMGAGALGAWLASPARALLQAVGGASTSRPSSTDLIARMTLEEKAGQLQLMASAWGGGAALALNPPAADPNFQQQVEEARQGQLTGVFNGNGATMARILQTAAVERIADEDPADLRRRHHPRPPHDLPGPARRGRELRARSCTPHRRGRGIRGRRARASTGPSRRWSMSRATSAGAAGVEGGGEDVLLGRLFAAARVAGLPGQRPQVERASARLHQAFRGLWRGRIRARLQHRRHVRASGFARSICRPTRPGSTPARCRRWPRSTRSTACPRPATTG